MRKWGYLSLLILSVLSLAACAVTSSPAPSSEEIEVVDAAGRSVRFSAPPRRIVIGGRANFMLNDAVYLFPDAPDRVLALTKATQAAEAFVGLLDPNAQDKLRFTSDVAAEEIAAAEPDLVLLKGYMKASLGDALEMLGIPVIYLDLETPEQYRRDVGTLGRVMANPERADAVWAYYAELLDRVAQRTSDLADTQKPRVLLLQFSEKGGEVAFEVPPAAWIQTQLVELAGGVPVWKSTAQGGGWATVNLEQIAAWNADQIFIINYRGSAVDVVNQLETDPQWAELAATKAGRLYPFPGDYYTWDQPDTRWGLGLLWLARSIQPERFSDVEMEAEVYRFFETLYGLDRAVIEAEIMPRIADQTFR